MLYGVGVDNPQTGFERQEVVERRVSVDEADVETVTGKVALGADGMVSTTLKSDWSYLTNK